MESLVPSKSKLALQPHRDRERRLARWVRLAAVPILAFAVVQHLLADSAAATNSTPGNNSVTMDPAAANSSAVDPATMEPPGANETLLLEVIVNGHSIGKIGEFVIRHGTLYARPQELRDLDFRVPNTRASRGAFMALNDLPGISWKMDTASQQLLVSASDAALVPNVVQPAQGEVRESRRPIESGTGLTLNYDTVGTFNNGQSGGSGSFDLRNFSPWGIASSDWITYAGSALQSSGTKPIVRLDSAYTFADVKSLRRYSVGDYIDNGLSWSRPVHMEGVQIRSDFTMRPDLITFPLPTVNGSAAVPSTVDVLVNGGLVTSSEVSPGPFEVPQLPVISGEGTITMTLTNTLGGQVTVTQPFYGASTLLAKGLQTFAGQAGLVRRNWGLLSNDYGKMAGAAYYRRGLSQTLTVEATTETTPGAFMGGGGAAATLWHRALVNFDVAGSGGPAGAGELLSAGVQHQGRIFDLGGSASVANGNYRDIAEMNGSPIPRKQISLFTGMTLRRYGSLGLAYAGVSQSPSPVQLPNASAVPAQSHVVTGNYSLQVHRVSFFATEFRDLDMAGSNGLQVGLTIPLSRRSSVSIGGSSNGTVQVQAQQSPIRIGDWGYQGYLSTGGDSTQTFGVAQYKSPVGLFSAGVDNSSGQTTVRLESQGALSLADRSLFPSNSIYDSFAIVDTAPLGRVHVYQENRDVGTTDKSGRLLVPDMRSFDVNHIGIEARDVPADADLALDKRIVRPQDRSGVVIRFPIQFSHGALLKLVDQTGLPIPVGSTVMLLGSSAPAPVGYDGEAYVEGLSAHNRIAVKLEDGKHCTATFNYKPIAGDIPTIGPLRCQEVKP
ncbi:MAG: fimbria/pilus outer membrane usher protein [Terracidiphilus sp.]